MLAEYIWRGNRWMFDEATAPPDAVPVKAAGKPRDKARRAKDKRRPAGEDKTEG